MICENVSRDEDGVLTWDAVNGASAYVVSVNGQEFTVGECRYYDFEPGKQISGTNIKDYAPTIAALLDVKADSFWEGKSLL